MYTVPITLYLYIIGIASREELARAFFPVENNLLWFAGCYIVLVLVSPALNLLLKESSKRTAEFLLISFFCLSNLFITTTANLGFFQNDIWTFMFLYVLTGYIKKYHTAFNYKTSLIIFLLCWGTLTLFRTLAAEFGWTITGNYCEIYRARLQSIPNILMAYTLFFGFLGLKIRPSIIINTMASATLGVYCFHQVPVWYGYLWEHFFNASYYADALSGLKRMVYTLCSIFIVWLVGTLIEIFRIRLSAGLIENRKWYNSSCRSIDNWANNNTENGKAEYSMLKK